MGVVGQRVAEAVAGKALRQLRQDLQVLLRRVLRHAHREYQVDRCMVAGTEIDRVFEPQERTAGGGKRSAARVRDGHAVADRGARSEERRGGKACGIKCRSRLAASHSQQKTNVHMVLQVWTQY